MVKGMHGKKPGEECAQTFADAGRFHLQHDTNRRLNVVLKARSFHLRPFYTVGEEMLGPVSVGYQQQQHPSSCYGFLPFVRGTVKILRLIK